MKWLHPSFWVTYDKSTYPTVADAQQAIERYCRENGHTCRFLDDDTVEIDGVPHEIYRGYEPGSRGNYGINTCRFLDDDTVEIDGVPHEIYRGYEPGSRGNYGIKCRKL